MSEIDRGIWSHPLLDEGDPFSRREAWLWLISEAAWKVHRSRCGGTYVNVDRGEAFDVTPIVGLRIELQRGGDKPCTACGRSAVVIGQGRGPHFASLQCAECDRHRGWLPKPIVGFLMAVINRFGRPSENLVIGNSTTPDAHLPDATGDQLGQLRKGQVT